MAKKSKVTKPKPTGPVTPKRKLAARKRPTKAGESLKKARAGVREAMKALRKADATLNKCIRSN